MKKEFMAAVVFYCMTMIMPMLTSCSIEDNPAPTPVVSTTPFGDLLRLTDWAVATGMRMIQVLPVTAETSKMKVTVKADIPFMLKGMVAGPLQDGVEKIADALSQIPYV